MLVGIDFAANERVVFGEHGKLGSLFVFVDCAVIVSNDSDLAEPIRLVHEALGLKVGLISPTYLRGRHPSRQLARHADFIKKIRKGVLSDSLFPDPVLSPNGPIHKPRGW